MAFGDEWDLRSYQGSPSSWFPSLYFGGAKAETASGTFVNEDTALNYSAVWLATTLYSSIVSTLPREMSRLLDKDASEPAKGHPLRKVFRKRICKSISSTNFFTLTVPWLINNGNIVCVKRYNSSGTVNELIPVHPSRVIWQDVKEAPDGYLRYPIRLKREHEADYIKTFHQEDIFHVGGAYTANGFCFEGVIPHGNESIGLGMVTEKYGARFFANDAHAGTVIEVPDLLGNESFARLKNSWIDNTGPDKAHSPVILEQGGKINRLGLAPEQAQFLQTRKHNITEIARWYNLPVHMLKEMQDSGVRANIEQEGINFVVYSLLPWLVKIEEAFNEQCLHPKDQDYFEFKFEVKGLLRGDAAARAAFYKELFATGALNADTILRLEDMEPIGGTAGQQRFVPANFMTHEQHAAATKQAIRLAEAPLPQEQNTDPINPESDRNPSEPADQERDNNLEAKLEDVSRLLLQRLDSLPETISTKAHPVPSENGYLKEETFRAAIKELQATGQTEQDTQTQNKDGVVFAKFAELERKLLMQHATPEDASNLVDTLDLLYMQVGMSLMWEYSGYLGARYKQALLLLDTPVQEIAEALETFLETQPEGFE